MKQSRTILISAGGTGGHIFPAQALADEIEALGWSVVFCTDARGLKYSSHFSSSVKKKVLVSASLARGRFFDKFFALFLIIYGLLATFIIFFREKPDVVVGFGGYPSFPALCCAKIFRLPCILHEQNAVLGLVNSLFVKHVDLVACGFFLKEIPTGLPILYTGNPVRKEILKHKNLAENYDLPDSGKLFLLVIGGSQGASIFSKIVPSAILALPKALSQRLTVYHQARPEDYKFLTSYYKRISVNAQIKCFFDNIDELIVKSHVVIARAGASTISELTVIGRPSILIPLPSAMKDHQTLNSKSLSDAGGAITLNQKNLTTEMLTKELKSLLFDNGRAKKMAKEALRYGKPLAAKCLADRVENLYLRLKK